MTIGQRMRDRRIELKIDPKDISEKIGKSISTYYRYETGEIEKLTISTMCEIAKVLQVSPVYLLLGVEENQEYNIIKKNDISNPITLTFSKQLKKMRESFAISPSTLASELNKKSGLNIAENEIICWENGTLSPEVAAFVAISEFFNVSLGYLVGNINTVKKVYISKPKVSEASAPYGEKSFLEKNLMAVLTGCKIPYNELAQKTGINEDIIKSYAEGTAKNIEIMNVKKIADALNMPVMDIMYEKNTAEIIGKISALNAVDLKILEDYIDKLLKDK